MKPILYSKSAEARARFVRYHLGSFGDTIHRVVYLVPRKFLVDVRQRHVCDAACWEMHFLAYEDITKSNAVFNLADDHSVLVFDRASRHKTINTDTFVRLSRVANQYQHKLLVDIVPFVSDVSYLYCPLALIDRGILGYQHWYSFRENNLELLDDGTQIRAFDYPLLARKLAPFAELDYDMFAPAWQTVDCPLSKEDRREYQALRDALFAANTTASPIITHLADWTNIRPARYARLRALLSSLPGRTAVYTNLASHNHRLQKAIPGVTAKSFYDANGSEDQYDAIILFELPIVRSYLFLDVLANIRPDCRVIIFRSDTTVETLLYNRLEKEITSINEFSKVLSSQLRVPA